jgi:hypothetical protein
MSRKIILGGKSRVDQHIFILPFFFLIEETSGKRKHYYYIVFSASYIAYADFDKDDLQRFKSPGNVPGTILSSSR